MAATTREEIKEEKNKIDSKLMELQTQQANLQELIASIQVMNLLLRCYYCLCLTL